MSYKVWGTQGQGTGENPDETFPTLEEALAFVRTHKDDASWGIEYPDGTWHDWSNEPKEPTVCSICDKPADMLASCCAHCLPHTYVCLSEECLNKHYDVCPENNRADKRFRLKSIEVKEYDAGDCVVCGTLTAWACSDCAIDKGGTTYVCNKTSCRDKHEETCSHVSL